MKKASMKTMVLIAAMIVSLCGCGAVQDKVTEKIGEGIAEKAIGGNVDITKDGVKVEKDGVSYETGNDLKWPKDAMGDLPEPKAKISAVLNADAEKGGSLAYEEMSLEDAKVYVEELKALGYKDGLNMSDEDLITYSGKNSDGYSVMFTYTLSTKGGSIMYTREAVQ